MKTKTVPIQMTRVYAVCHECDDVMRYTSNHKKQRPAPDKMPVLMFEHKCNAGHIHWLEKCFPHVEYFEVEDADAD